MKKQDTKHSEKLANKNIKDVYAVCSVCGTRFVMHENHKKRSLYCEECARKINIEQTLQRQELERSKKKNICKNCGCEFKKTGKRQKYCKNCQKDMKKLRDRIYQKNKKSLL